MSTWERPEIRTASKVPPGTVIDATPSVIRVTSPPDEVDLGHDPPGAITRFVDVHAFPNAKGNCSS